MDCTDGPKLPNSVVKPNLDFEYLPSRKDHLKKTKLQTIRTSMNGWNQIRVSTQDYMICPQQCCICSVTRDGFSYVMFISRMIYYVDGSGLLF